MQLIKGFYVAKDWIDEIIIISNLKDIRGLKILFAQEDKL